MSIKLLQSIKYKNISDDYIQAIISMLLEEDIEFAILTEKVYLNFEPQLPTEIFDTFDDIVLFSLSGYSHNSSQLAGDIFSFEAGFGSNDFGTLVTMPILAIKQIIVDDFPIATNMATPLTTTVTQNIKLDKNSTNKSMEALLSNPENQKLFDKN